MVESIVTTGLRGAIQNGVREAADNPGSDLAETVYQSVLRYQRPSESTWIAPDPSVESLPFSRPVYGV